MEVVSKSWVSNVERSCCSLCFIYSEYVQLLVILFLSFVIEVPDAPSELVPDICEVFVTETLPLRNTKFRNLSIMKIAMRGSIAGYRQQVTPTTLPTLPISTSNIGRMKMRPTGMYWVKHGRRVWRPRVQKSCLLRVRVRELIWIVTSFSFRYVLKAQTMQVVKQKLWNKVVRVEVKKPFYHNSAANKSAKKIWSS